MSVRVHFDDLFGVVDEILILRREIIIGGTKYQIGDVFDDASAGFMNNPEGFFYVVNPLRSGDTLESFIPLD